MKSKKTPSVLSLTRQNVETIRKIYLKSNKCSFGAYEVLRTKNKINLTLIASGSELQIAIDVSHKLAKYNIYSKVISMPCQEIFDLQTNSFKKKIMNETVYKASIEASTTDNWDKYIGKEGLKFGIKDFGRSAPYKDIYKYFGLTSENITKKIIKFIRK